MKKEEYDEREALDGIQRTIGRTITKLRVSKHMSQRQLAEFARMSNGNLGVIEAGMGNATVGILARLARVLGVSISSLFEGTDAAAVSGVEAMMAKLMIDMEGVRRHLEVRKDEVGRVIEDVEMFLDEEREKLKAVAAEGRRRGTEKK